ncbi:MAG: hypothetical protein VX463_15870 [Pseudomonadota bacterium]|nr:hypothetical protein [Pseudomonadota bacterium]
MQTTPNDPAPTPPSGSIGALEAAAGVGPDHAARCAFWRSFAHIRPAGASLDDGVAELRSMADAAPEAAR